MGMMMIHIQNERLELLKEPSPLTYTRDVKDAWNAQYDLSRDLTDLVEEFTETVIPAFKTMVANDANPKQAWRIVYLHEGTPYAKIDIEGGGVKLTGSFNDKVMRVKEADEFYKATRDTFYDYLLDIFGHSLLESSLSATMAAVASAMGGSSASFKSSDDVDAIIEKISQETKAEIVKPKETMADYVCNDVLKEQLDQIVDFFEHRDKYVNAGIEIPKGVLFKGPPGTGKTYAARCIAGTVDCYFMICTASSLQGMYIGSGAANIKAVFKGARVLAEKSGKGVIVFIDELDSVGNRTGDTGGAGDEVNRTINQLLAEMSGFNDDENIMVMGATNFSDVIDPALLRSGRFSRQITIDYPDDEQREQMLEHYGMKLKMPVAWDLADAAALTKSFTPADIKEAINVAAIKCVRKGEAEVSLDALNEAINEVITKDVRKPDNPKTLDLVTGHECGHVLMEVITKGTLPTKVTNYAYGDAGGFTQPSEILTGIVTKEDLINEVMILLGGRAAEEVLFKRITTGASNDLEKAKRILKNYFEKYDFEAYVVEDLDQTVINKLNDYYADTVHYLENNIMQLKRLCKALKSKRVLYAADIATLVTVPLGMSAATTPVIY